MDSQPGDGNIIVSNNSRVRPKKPLIIGIIVLAAIAVIVAVIVLVFNNKNNPGGSIFSPSSTSSSSAAASEDPGVLNTLNIDNSEDVSAARISAKNYQNAIIEKVNEDKKDVNAYSAACDEYEKQVEKLSGVPQLYYAIRYSEFVFLWEHSQENMNTVLNKAVKIAQKYEALATTDETRIDYLVNMMNLYVGAGKTTEAEIYRREIEKLTIGDQEGKG